MSGLSVTAKYEYYTKLANGLPPPVLKEPEHGDRRFTTAVETFEALRPGDAYEAQLAVRIVLCGAHADESLCLAGRYRDDFAKMIRCRAQAASMMRAEASAKRTLDREQKVRLAVEALAGAAPVRHEVTSDPPQQAELQSPRPILVAAEAAAPPSAPEPPVAAPPRLAEASPAPLPVPAAGNSTPPLLGAANPAPPLLAAVNPAPPRLAAANSTSPRLAAANSTSPLLAAANSTSPLLASANPAPLPVQAGSQPPPSPEAIAKAEAFTQHEIVAAAQIRHDGGVTPQSKAYFRHKALPSDPAVIDALVRGSSVALSILDEVGGEMLDAAD